MSQFRVLKFAQQKGNNPLIEPYSFTWVYDKLTLLFQF